MTVIALADAKGPTRYVDEDAPVRLKNMVAATAIQQALRFAEKVQKVTIGLEDNEIIDHMAALADALREVQP